MAGLGAEPPRGFAPALATTLGSPAFSRRREGRTAEARRMVLMVRKALVVERRPFPELPGAPPTRARVDRMIEA